jgi:hypothetical protein
VGGWVGPQWHQTQKTPNASQTRHGSKKNTLWAENRAKNSRGASTASACGVAAVAAREHARHGEVVVLEDVAAVHELLLQVDVGRLGLVVRHTCQRPHRVGDALEVDISATTAATPPRQR